VSGPAAIAAPLLFVVGMAREARILRGHGRILVGTDGLEAALEQRPAGVISFGLCGALDPGLRVGQLVAATAVATADGLIPTDETLTDQLQAAVGEFGAGPIAGSPVIVPGPTEKSALRQRTGAIAVDMESHEVARVAARAGVPFAVLRAVSDLADEALPLSAQAGFRPDGGVDVMAVIAGLARRPGELAALLRTARHAEAGFKALATAAARLG
jgi:adenosylhomocysteine nucleosidase